MKKKKKKGFKKVQSKVMRLEKVLKIEDCNFLFQAYKDIGYSNQEAIIAVENVMEYEDKLIFREKSL